MFKDSDISAINSFDNKNHLYLEVVGKGKSQHLETKSKGWFGRVWMKLGFSSASMAKVAKYIKSLDPPLQENTSAPKLKVDKIELLTGKLDSYYLKHIHYGVLSPAGNDACEAKQRLENIKNQLHMKD